MKKIVLCLFSLLIVLTLTACNSKKEQEEIKTEQKEEAIIIEDQQIDHLSFESFNVVLDDNNVSHIYFEVINNGIETNNISNVTFTLYKDDIKLITLTKSLDGPIEGNGMRIVEAAVDIDLSKINKVEYIVE